MHVFRDVVVPVLSAYVLMASVIVYAGRHPDAGRPQTPPSGWGARVRLIGVTVGGGYVCFLAIVLVFHVWVVGQRGAMASALHGGTFLAVVCAAAFLLGSVVEAMRR